jgi:dolichyl-phosphate-mannose--protein O-mannosyl transferase
MHLSCKRDAFKHDPYCFYRSETRRWLSARWIFLAAALAGFLVFLPISAASVETSLAGYERLMWFASWR